MRLTGAGRAEFARLAAAHEGWIEEVLGVVTTEEAAAMMVILDRVAASREGDKT